MCKANKRLQVKVHTQRTAFIGTDIGALLWTILIHFPYKKQKKKQKKQTNDLVISGKIAANSQLYNLIYKIVYFLHLFFSFFLCVPRQIRQFLYAKQHTFKLCVDFRRIHSIDLYETSLKYACFVFAFYKRIDDTDCVLACSSCFAKFS